MKIVIFGLTISSSWGNGHATLWRGLCKALARRNHHRIVFFERDVPYYAGARDLYEWQSGSLVLYPRWEDVQSQAYDEIRSADVVMVTSYCPDALSVTELLGGRALNVFYDLDTPVTLARLSGGNAVPYIGPRGLRDFDLVLSYTGGRALTELSSRLGARMAAPLYGHVDPELHQPEAPRPHYRSDLSYLGTYSADRQHGLESYFIHPARQRPHHRFLIGGAQYPQEFPWTPNIYFVRHLPPSEHAAFFSSSRLTLNITRAPMAQMGWCPSGRLFEAAACGVPVLSDDWEGLDHFFTPDTEILVARKESDALAALDLPDAELERIGRAARERVMTEHTSERRAIELLAALESARRHAGPSAVVEKPSLPVEA
jgi:spore maturation protein CgeB